MEPEPVFTIELTLGPAWDKPVQIVAAREILTESVAAAAAEAHHWLVTTQRAKPGAVSHYRIIQQSRIVLGGPALR